MLSNELGKLNRIYVVSAVVFILLLAFYVKVLAGKDWNPREFVFETPPGVSPDRGYNVGYDGRFSFHIATNPWGSTIGLDQPAYRYQRIFYPFLVHILSLGQASVVPWMMIGVNLIAAVLGCFFLGVMLQKRGASPWYALVLIFSIGYLLALRMDLLEPLALSLALIGLYLYEKDKIYFSILFFALGGLTKEMALVFPFALLVWEGLRSNWCRCLLLACSFVLYILWYFVVNSWMGTTDTQIAKSTLMIIPFSGFAYLKDPVSRVVAFMWVLLPAILGVLFATIDLIRKFGSNLGRDVLLVIGQVVLIASMPMLTWEDPIAILRIGLGLIIAILLWLASFHPRLLPYAAGLWLPSCLLIFLVPGIL